MPVKNFAPCTYPGCNTLVRGGRCDKHPYPAKERVSTYKRGYTAEWRSASAKYREAHPTCEYRVKCRGAPATEVDHVIPLGRGGSHDPSNLKACCKRCHSHKTATRDSQRTDGGKFHGNTTTR